jgi:hypothetical protein
MKHMRLRELHVAARVADGLVYVAGAAGVVAGALLFREGSLAFAAVAWVLTFVAGAGLRLAAWGARALAELLERTRRIEDDLAAVRSHDHPPADPGGPPDPYRRWGGWH